MKYFKKKYLIAVILVLTLFATLSFATVRQGHESYKQIDDDSAAYVTIDNEHRELHEGHSFERHIDSANTAVATLNVAFKTGPGPNLVHMLFGFSSNDEVLWEFLEGATWTQGSGTAIDFFNHNRQSTYTSTEILEDKNQAPFTASSEVIKDVTGISGGVQFEKQYTYNAGVPQAHTAESREAGHEWVLNPNTTYVIRLTQTDGNCKMSIDLHWYEHKPTNVYPDDIIFVPRW